MSGLDLPPVTPPAKDRRRKGEETAIVVLSDWQLGKSTPSYSSDVCEERVALYADKVASITELQRADHPIRRLEVALVGDMVEGELIFPGQHWEIDASLYRQVTVDGPRILGDFLRRMLGIFETVHVTAVPGNHGAIGGRSRRDMHPESNADRMLYTITEQVVTDDRLSWTVPEKDWKAVIDIGDRARFLLLHGHQVRGYAGIPWYGWMRKTAGWVTMERLGFPAFDAVLAGHFHTPVSLYMNGVRVWINGSTESHNPYAAEQLAAAGEPSQWLLFAQSGKGVTAEYLIRLADVGEDEATPI